MPLYEFLRLAIEKLESSQQKPCSVDPSSEKEIDLFGKSITCDVVHNLIRSSPLIDGDDVGSAQNRTREELDYDGPPTPLELNPKSHRDLAPDGPRTKAKNISLETFLKNDKNLTRNSNITDSTSVESIVVSSNLFDKQRDYRERKSSDNEESECQSDELQNGKMNPAEGGRGSKRRRVAEMHNLSERRRRDRINQKMQALQELIPNCSNKADKASMLDEAIEYLKNLKHQVQIMSMGHGLCVAPGSRHVYYAPMPHSSYMGVNFGGSPVFHVSSIHGAHFIPPTSLMGSSALRVPNHDQVPLTPSKLIMKKNSKSVLSSINCNHHGSTQSSKF